MAKNTNTVDLDSMIAKAVASAMAAALPQLVTAVTGAAPKQSRQMTTAKPSNVVDVGGICLVFDGKPSDSVRAGLKRHGFVYNPDTRNWLSAKTEDAVKFAASLTV